MSIAQEIIIPLINPNEPDAVVAQIYVEEGQQVAAGDLICTLETTKSTVEVEAGNSGYIVGLCYEENANVRAGDLFCYLADTPT